MSGRITLTVQKGSLSGQTFIYTGEEKLTVGRKNSSSIQLPDNTVSSKHCIIDIKPPSVVVRDCSSLNGTYINGVKIEQRRENNSSREFISESYPLKSGDLLGLGKSCELRVEIKPLLCCVVCEDEIDELTFKGTVDNTICEECHSDPDKVLKHLINKAQEGQSKT